MTKKKPIVKPWVVGDALVVDGIRWGITILIEERDHVELKALSTTNHGMGWTTTLTRLNKLPRKAA